MQKQNGLSVSKLVRRALELDAKSTEEAYNLGYLNGYGRFESPCSRCGKPMSFDIKAANDAEAKKALLLAFSKWAHTSCLQNQE